MLLDWLIQVCLVIKSNIWRRQMTNKDWLIGFLSFFEFKTNSCHTLPKARNKQDINSERSHSELYPYDPKGLKEQGGRGHPRGKPHEPWINTENSSACDFKFAFLQYKMPTHISPLTVFHTQPPPSSSCARVHANCKSSLKSSFALPVTLDLFIPILLLPELNEWKLAGAWF